uniref:ATP synthase subunit 6 n=1 Tax=Hydatigera parva TaxID=1434711 RepID=N0DP27_9CEST|nr:ATP synthase F0 subunit 6 [Hydatigera parva]BAN15658.1 ATP synthase subunit 6 [Hydatigera parva]
MFSVINDCGSFLNKIYSFVMEKRVYYYFNIIMIVLLLFLTYRFPYCYSPYIFVMFLVCVVFSCFISLFLGRVVSDVNSFFASFVPVGTPLFICPLVCIAELVSYCIRPVVLIIRPFVNISLGCFGAVALGSLIEVNVWWWILLFVLFFYEVFVAVVHWFIVLSILLFSENH